MNNSKLDLRKTPVTPDAPPLHKKSFSAVRPLRATPPSDKAAFESVDGAPEDNKVSRKSSKKRDKHITREIHKLFWRGNFQDKRTLILSYLFRVPAVAIYNTFIPLVGAYAIQMIISKQFGEVNKYAVLVIVLSLLYSLLWALGDLAIDKNSIKGAKYVQNEVFSNYLNKDYEFYSNAYFGSLGAQASRLRTAFDVYGYLFTFSIPKQLTIVITGVGIIAYKSPQLAIITLLSMVLVLGFTILSSSWRLQFRRKESETSSVVAANIGDALTHGTTVKSFATEDYEIQRLSGPLETWAKAQYKTWNAAIPANIGRMVLAALATAALLVFSSKLYQQGDISITIVVLVQLYVIKLVASTIDIAEIVKQYEQTMGAAYEPVKTMLIEPAVIDPDQPQVLADSSKYYLKLSDVSFKYPESKKEQYAIKNFSLDAKPGEKIGIVGYSGSGKTTLTKLLLRFMDVTNGAIEIDDIDIRKLKQKDLRRIVSYVPQEPLLFHRSIGENITYAKPNATKAEIEHAAKLAYVSEFIDEMPKGFDTLVGERGVKLSGGQRQRVAIARAILKDSPILVLDEATSALDSKSEKYIQDALWHLMENRTTIVIAHRLSTIQRMDRIVVMDKGIVVQTGTHEELKGQPGIYADLWAHQSGGYIGAKLNEGDA